MASADPIVPARTDATARDHALPFDVRPNAETVAAIEEACRDSERGVLPRFDSTADLLTHLNAESRPIA